MLLELHYLEVVEADRSKMPVVEAASLYRDANAVALFIVHGTESTEADDGAAPVVQSAAAVADVTCPLCKGSIVANMMHNHMGAHILLEDDWSQYGEVKPAFPCGLCGIRSAIMCKSAIAAEQVVDCPISCEMRRPPGGGKATLKPVHQCKLLSGVQYSLTSRETSSASSPSTNRPVACPVCELYGWSYGMADHVASGSCSGAKDAAAVVRCEPAYHEREWLKPFLGTNMKPRTKACKEPSCPCKRKR